MKSLVPYLSDYLTMIFADFRWVYRCSDQRERDLSRLQFDLKVHGSRVLTIDLPTIGKHFEKCLSEGLYTPSGFAFASPRGGSRFPALFRDLFLQIFDVNGVVREDASVEAIRAIGQLCYGVKKLELQCPQDAVNEQVKEYLLIEDDIREPSLPWGTSSFVGALGLRPSFKDGLRSCAPTVAFDGNRSNITMDQACDLLQQVADKIAAQFGDLHLEKSTELPKHGPGVVSNLKSGESKYSFPMWNDRLEATFPYDLYARTDFGMGEDHEAYLRREGREAPSRLIAVPKTQKGPRLIAAEPVENQWVQQLVRSQLEGRLSQTWLHSSIHFRSQLVNRKWARDGSIDGSLATIDLSSASDRLSCWTVERMFRSNQTLLQRLESSRTSWVQNRVTDHHWSAIRTKKFAPMGSAVTFPVQSICYAIVSVVGVLLSQERMKPTAYNIQRACAQVQVFGDDLIVPAEAYRYVEALLEYIGLKVNRDKTYTKGNFRESCGLSVYKGYCVTPAYLVKPSLEVTPATLGSLVEVSNNFHRKGLWNVANWLRLALHKYRNSIPVVPEYAVALGFFSFMGGSVSHLRKRRWNDSLHREEVRVWVPRHKVPKLPTPGSYRLAQYFIESPDPLTQWESGTNGKSVNSSSPGWCDPNQILVNLIPEKERDKRSIQSISFTH